MPKRCARCSSLAGRGRELQLPNDWLAYLRDERDMSAPLGRSKMPLCRDCHREAENLLDGLDAGEGSVEDRNDFLDDLDLDVLVDEQT